MLCINENTFEDHLSKLDKVLEIIQSISVKINTTKSCFAQPELEYLGHWITREGIMTTHKKVQEISNITVHKINKQLRSFIGMIKNHMDMCTRRWEILSLLTQPTSKNFKW